MMKAFLLLWMKILLALLACTFTNGLALNTCERNYIKVGCYDNYRPVLRDLVVYERYEIKWDDIENYIHHLACACEEKIRGLNKGRSEAEKYAGFALHYWAECYGRTQRQIDLVAGSKSSVRCTGDKSYRGCFESNKECTGHAFSEYVYRIRPQLGEIRDLNVCNGGIISMGCSAGAYVFVRKAAYAPRTNDTCGAPVTGSWRPECATVSNLMFSTIIRKCSGHSTCDIADWKNDQNDPCPDVPKLLTVTYQCKAKKHLSVSSGQK